MTGKGRRSGGRATVELVWEGKYDAKGQLRPPRLPPAPPLHLSEVYTPTATEPALGATGHAASAPPPNSPGDPTPDSPGNLLLRGDNLAALAALLPTWRNRLRLIYCDPPFDVGTDFTVRVPLRQSDAGAPDHLERLAYSDKWGRDEASYLQMMYERLLPLHALLQEGGCLFLHCDWRSNAHLRLMLDEVFGVGAFVNEIVWHYYNKYSAGKGALPRAHDSILVYAKGGKARLNPLREPRDTPRRQLVRHNVNGVLRNARDPEGKLLYRESTSRKVDDVWRIPQLQPASHEWTGYRTQKHHELLRRVVELASDPGDWVADFFCGSGTFPAVAQDLGRRWLACDVGDLAIHLTRKRLLGRLKPGGTPPLHLFDLGRPASVSGTTTTQGHAIVHWAAPSPQAPDESPVLHLTDYQPPEGSPGSASTGLNLVDFWALAPEPSTGDPLQPCWWSFRTAKRPTLITQSAPLPSSLLAVTGSWRLLLIDRLGHRTEQAVPPAPACQPPASPY